MYNGKTDEVLQTIRNIGSVSAQEIARMTDRKLLRVHDSLRRLRKRGEVYVARYERQPDGLGGRCIPMYSTGCGVDAVPPKRRSRKDVNARYRERHSAIIKARADVRHGRPVNIWEALIRTTPI